MWQIQPTVDLPDWIIPTLQEWAPQVGGKYIAQLLIARGINSPEQLVGFLHPQHYHPASPFEFGEEMKWAVERLILARQRSEKVTIWGDFDADGITSTAVLWDGLGQFLSREGEFPQLSYYIPNRLTESHGLNCPGIDRLHEQGCNLIVTCDTGSTNLKEIEYAQELGIDIIVTDHHSLLEDRPPVVAIINPRHFPPDHPLYHLSGVAVAYKFVEALYETRPDIPQCPLDDLLDLVAIGLIADLVQLKGDCRYLAQLGIEKLQQQLKNPTRPGVSKLLDLCKKTGDRPTDISFGLGPRINAVSRIYGDAKFCVELLTSRNPKRASELALDTELANSRRKAIQQDVTRDITQKLSKLDLSTTQVIVLCDPQWPGGVLGLVAGQIAQEYGRPTILLTTETPVQPSISDDLNSLQLARGSARSVNQIDLYELVKSQQHLLHRFGGHPLAAGLSLPVENLRLFTDAINRQLREQFEGLDPGKPSLQVDLTCQVADLGFDLFQELKLLEPCGMGNPAPKLFIKNCWFSNPWNSLEKDLRGRQVRYIKTTFELGDDSSENTFPGVWWGHYKDELPIGRCDVVVELDFNTYNKRYEVRLIDWQFAETQDPIPTPQNFKDQILDWRNLDLTKELSELEEMPMILKTCPLSWEELQIGFRRAYHQNQKLAIAYSLPEPLNPQQTWEKLVGIAKYLSRTNQPITRQTLINQLKISDITLKLGFNCLKYLGFQINATEQGFYFTWQSLSTPTLDRSQPLEELTQQIEQFLLTVQEEQFRRQYFCEVPLSLIQALTIPIIINEVTIPPDNR